MRLYIRLEKKMSFTGFLQLVVFGKTWEDLYSSITSEDFHLVKFE